MKFKQVRIRNIAGGSEAMIQCADCGKETRDLSTFPASHFDMKSIEGLPCLRCGEEIIQSRCSPHGGKTWSVLSKDPAEKPLSSILKLLHTFRDEVMLHSQLDTPDSEHVIWCVEQKNYGEALFFLGKFTCNIDDNDFSDFWSATLYLQGELIRMTHAGSDEPDHSYMDTVRQDINASFKAVWGIDIGDQKMNITPAILIAALKTHPMYAQFTDIQMARLSRYAMSVEETSSGGVRINMYNGAEPDLAAWTIHITSAQWHKLQKK